CGRGVRHACVAPDGVVGGGVFDGDTAFGRLTAVVAPVYYRCASGRGVAIMCVFGFARLCFVTP
ncbi:hypothetical protein, partial [Escherichia coli]|uniref:hypothetical protein n=1 Tax=Escherichia coli TaxID=562 RepID=UPI001BC89C93